MSPLGTSRKGRGTDSCFQSNGDQFERENKSVSLHRFVCGGCNFGLHFQQVEMFPRGRELLTGMAAPDTPSLEQGHLFLRRGRENFLKCGLPCFKLVRSSLETFRAWVSNSLGGCGVALLLEG